jgi:hypothetical protein
MTAALADDSVSIRRISARGIGEGDLRRQLAALPTPRVQKYVFVRRLTLRAAPDRLGAALRNALEGLAETAGDDIFAYRDFPALAVACVEAALSGNLDAWHWRRLHIPAQAGPGAALAALLADNPLEAGAAVTALAARGLLAPVWRDLDAAAVARLIGALSAATGLPAPDWPEAEDWPEDFLETREESELSRRAAAFWAPILAALPARAPGRRVAAFFALLRWAPGLLRRPQTPAVRALLKNFAAPSAGAPSGMPLKGPTSTEESATEAPPEPSFPPDRVEAEKSGPSVRREPPVDANATLEAPREKIAGRTQPPPLAADAPVLPEARDEVETRGEAIVTDWGGVFFLINALRRLDISSRLDALGEQAPSGWRLLQQLGQLLGLPAEEPLSLFFEREDCATQAPSALIDELAAGLEALYAMRGPWPFPARRLARLRADETHLDVDFLAETIDLDLRLAGLDLNPGWTPWLGRVVTFQYPNMPIFTGGGF